MAGARQSREKQIRADAAAWLARIHSDEALESDIAAFRLWVTEDVRHQEAFDAVTSVWETVGGIRRLEYSGPLGDSNPQRNIRRRVIAGTAGLAVLLPVLWKVGRDYWTEQSPAASHETSKVYATAIGEQRRVVLSDGSTATVDSDSSISVDARFASRTVRHLKGRVNFDVEHDPKHPFVVEAGETRVTALWTSFEVERTEESLRVMLVSGSVEVVPVVDDRSVPSVQLHSPGERLSLAQDRMIRRDKVAVAAATAWQNGRLVFDNETVREAAAEMNRYSKRKIRLEPGAEYFRISGNYRTADTEAFAMSLTELLPLSGVFMPDEIILSPKNKTKQSN